MERYQKQAILRDLNKKMVILAGPRQAGKTTLAKSIANEFQASTYLSFDNLLDRKTMLELSWLPTEELIILDEIHKMPNWRSYLTNVCDKKLTHQKVLVTGSARLEMINQVEDTLANRYLLHRLMPISPAECEKVGVSYTLDHFLARGGFPDPFLSEDALQANHWRSQYVDNLLSIDVLEFENIHNLHAIRLVFELLRERVGSPISYTSIAEDVSISPNTVRKYIEILEALYIIFRVTPYSYQIARSLLKEPKVYFFDVGLVSGPDGIKFENLVAVCLYKHVCAKVDCLAEGYSLHYLQTKDSREVDFAIVLENQIEKMIEVKYGNHSISKGLKYFHQKYRLPAYQVVKELKREKIENEIEILGAQEFLKSLFL